MSEQLNPKEEEALNHLVKPEALDAISQLESVALALGIQAGIEAIDSGDIDEEENEDYWDLGSTYWFENFSDFAKILYQSFGALVQEELLDFDLLKPNLFDIFIAPYLRYIRPILIQQNRWDDDIEPLELSESSAREIMKNLGWGLGILSALDGLQYQREEKEEYWMRSSTKYAEAFYEGYSQQTKDMLDLKGFLKNVHQSYDAGYSQSYTVLKEGAARREIIGLEEVIRMFEEEIENTNNENKRQFYKEEIEKRRREINALISLEKSP